MRSALASLVMLALCAPLATASVTPELIEAYNSAFLSGNAEAQKSAARDLADGAMSDPQHPEAGLFAFEAAWTLCRFGACADGLNAARFAASQAGAPEHAPLLAAYAEWKVKPNKANRQKLESALTSAIPKVASSVSITAFRELYFSEAQKERFENAGRIARQAVTHFAPGGNAVVEFEIEARHVAIISGFTDSQDIEELEEMIDLAGRLNRMRRESSETPEWMKDAYWRAEAWRMAMTAVFESRGERVPSDEAQLARIEAFSADLPPKIDEDETEKLRFCSGELVQRPSLVYPQEAANQGLVGAVLIGFSVRDGQMVDPKVLASVPNEGFKESALATVSKWKWKVTEDATAQNCRLDYKNMMVPLIWSFD